MTENGKTSWCDRIFTPWTPKHQEHPSFCSPYSVEMQKTTHWHEPYFWNNLSRANNQRLRVSCSATDTCDVFDEHVNPDPNWRAELWSLIENTPHLDWLLLTAHPQNVCKMVPTSWLENGFPPQIWMGATAKNQEEAQRNVPALAVLPTRIRFLSCEPLLGPLDLRNISGVNAFSHIHWVITDRENPSNLDQPDLEWIRKLRDDCNLFQSKFLFKHSNSSKAFPLLDGQEHHTHP